MQQVTIQLDDRDAAFADAQVRSGRFGSAESYVSSLIAQDAARQLDQEGLGRALDVGVRSGEPETLDDSGLGLLRGVMRVAAGRSAT